MKSLAAASLAAFLTGAALAGASPLQPGKPGTTFRDCANCPEMVVIPAGTFTMGAPPDEPGYFVIEGPQHKVRVKSFAAGKFDVTRGQWAAFVADTKRAAGTGCWSTDMKGDGKEFDWNHLGFEQDDSHPVVCLNWNDTQDYVKWLSARTGRTYRLLSEAEWEFAARAGSTTPFSWGRLADHEHANYGNTKFQTLGFKSGRDQWQFTSPSGSFPPNAFGLHDMNGNALQWVQDCLSATYDGLPTDGSANEADVALVMPPELKELNGAKACTYHMLRGGDWNDPADMIRSGFRNFGPPPGAPNGGATGATSFRVAVSLD